MDRDPGDDDIVLQSLGFGRLVTRALFGLAWFRDGAELHDLAVEHNMISRNKVNMCHVNWFPTITRLSLVCLASGVVHAEAIDPALQPPTINASPDREYADDARRFQGIPGIERAANGRLWAVWYAGGADENAEGPGNYVVLVTSGDDGKTWSGPKLVIDPPGEVRAYDPCLWHDPDGKLWLFWAQSYNWWDGRSGVWCTVTDKSSDEAPHWTAPRRLCNGIMMNKPTVISTGEWLLPASVWPKPATDRTAPEYRHDLGKESGANVHVSRDEGATWVLRGQVHVPNRVFDEHMIVERHDGSLWMLVRAAYGIGESFSLDCGKTWTPGRQSKIPHVNARFFIRRLNSGNLLLVTHEPPDGKSRSHLVARISEDDGKTWRGGLMIDTRPGISYPDGVQSRDGTIYLIYDYSRTGQKQVLMATFKEDDATSGKWSSAATRQRVLVNQATFVPLDVRAASLPKIRVAADGRTFETEDGRPFVPIGVNYFRPGTGWAPQLWKQFDAEATRQDFLRMKQMGVTCVRVFLTYGSFLTEPHRLNDEGLEKLDQLLKIAEQTGIYIHPTGPDHWEGVPKWAATDRIADPDVLAALETFWKLLARRYQGRQVLFAYDLLNEPQVGWNSTAMRTQWNRYLKTKYPSAEALARAWQVDPEEISWGSQSPPEPKPSSGDSQLLDYQSFRESVADEWTRRQATAIKSVDPDALVTVGLIQWSVPAKLPGVQHYSAFRPARMAKLLDFLEIHFYPLATGFYDYTTDEQQQRNLAYLESILREVAAPGRPVVLAEFGWYGGGKLTINQGRHPAASEENQARWCRGAVETSLGLATGWLNWGLYDHPEARDVTQLTGLLSADGRLKAWGHEFKRLAGELRSPLISPTKMGSRPELPWDRCLTNPAAGDSFRDDYYQAFRQQSDIPRSRGIMDQ